jgi:hypothetical protein
MKKLLLIGALALFMAPTANAVLQAYDVTISGTLTTSFGPGTVTGGGTATLDAATGILLFNTTLTATIPAAAAVSVVDVSGDITGSLSVNGIPTTMTGGVGTDQIDTCADFGVTPVCSFIVLGLPAAMTSVSSPIVFQDPSINWTFFQTSELFASGAATADLNWTLTPEPGTAFLLVSGLAGLAGFGRRQRA